MIDDNEEEEFEEDEEEEEKDIGNENEVLCDDVEPEHIVLDEEQDDI